LISILIFIIPSLLLILGLVFSFTFFLFLLLILIFCVRVWLCGPGWLEFVILLPQPPECWDYRCVPPHPALSSLFFNFYCCPMWGTLWHLHRFLQCSKYIIFELTPSKALLYPPLIPGVVSTGIIFAFEFS
jgi:hypothetical protein